MSLVEGNDSNIGDRSMASAHLNMSHEPGRLTSVRMPHMIVVTSSATLIASYLLKQEPEDVSSAWSAISLVCYGLLLAFVVFFAKKRRRHLDCLSDATAPHWYYVAEGALNIALRYHGKDRCLQGKILRLRKKSKLSRIKSSVSQSSDIDLLDEDDPAGADDLEEALTSANSFVNNVMSQILSPKFVAQCKVIKLSPRFIDEVARNIEDSRPEKRRQVTVLNRNAGCGLLTKDSAQIPCGCSNRCTSYCFELKPKWGFLSTESLEWDVKRRVDRFTMHQHLKKSLDQSVEISEYCPLDLFHGGREGILKSLQALEKHPQNNLRLFINGKMSFPDRSKRPLESVVGGSKIKETLIQVLTETLLKEKVLDHVLRAQTLSPLNDIESVYPIYMQLYNSGLGDIDIHNGYDENYHPKVPPESDRDKLEIVKRFLISCTARDCSIMITLSPCPSPLREPLGRSSAEGKWSYEITVVDLDAKPISKMSYYHKVDRDIARTYMEKVEGIIRRHNSSFVGLEE